MSTGNIFISLMRRTENGIISAIYECYVQLKNQAKISEYEKILEERYK